MKSIPWKKNSYKSSIDKFIFWMIPAQPRIILALLTSLLNWCYVGLPYWVLSSEVITWKSSQNFDSPALASINRFPLILSTPSHSFHTLHLTMSAPLLIMHHVLRLEGQIYSTIKLNYCLDLNKGLVQYLMSVSWMVHYSDHCPNYGLSCIYRQSPICCFAARRIGAASLIKGKSIVVYHN